MVIAFGKRYISALLFCSQFILVEFAMTVLTAESLTGKPFPAALSPRLITSTLHRPLRPRTTHSIAQWAIVTGGETVTGVFFLYRLWRRQIAYDQICTTESDARYVADSAAILPGPSLFFRSLFGGIYLTCLVLAITSSAGCIMLMLGATVPPALLLVSVAGGMASIAPAMMAFGSARYRCREALVSRSSNHFGCSPSWAVVTAPVPRWLRHIWWLSIAVSVLWGAFIFVHTLIDPMWITARAVEGFFLAAAVALCVGGAACTKAALVWGTRHGVGDIAQRRLRKRAGPR